MVLKILSVFLLKILLVYHGQDTYVFENLKKLDFFFFIISAYSMLFMLETQLT